MHKLIKNSDQKTFLIQTNDLWSICLSPEFWLDARYINEELEEGRPSARILTIIGKRFGNSDDDADADAEGTKFKLGVDLSVVGVAETLAKPISPGISGYTQFVL